MAAHRLCTRMVESGTVDSHAVTIFGAEPTLAYDRVNLSKTFASGDSGGLTLAPAPWYAEQKIEFQTGCRIVSIDRQHKRVTDDRGSSHPYDELVLATGSRAFMPPIPGHDTPGVYVYRTLDDLERIRERCDRSDVTRGAVIGGGLLGLEAAKVLYDAGLSTSVIEMAPGLMPRQLDSEAAKRLRQQVESMGVAVHTVRRTKAIEACDERSLLIHFENADPLTVDILIVAAGVRPNDELARDAGLDVGSRGGIVVNSSLQTNDPHIHAIGECVCHHDHVYGLVAPCYRMADVLAERFAGIPAQFLGADESAELKLMGIGVVTLGRVIGESPAGVVLSQQDDQAYRRILLEHGRMVGAACVGTWEELPQIRRAIVEGTRLWPTQRIRFRRTGSPWASGSLWATGGALPVEHWPADAVVCSCQGVTRGQISEAIDAGADSFEAIAVRTGAASSCGSCRSMVCQLAGSPPAQVAVPGARVMGGAAITAAILLGSMAVLPSVEMATSVQAAWRQIDWWWRDDLARQMTGFTTLGILIAGMVFSLRKRFDWFRWGTYSFWRSVHAVLGTLVLVALAAHTGLRMGSHLNFVLASCFLGTALVGSVVGVISGMESRLEGTAAMNVRRWRPRLARLHAILFWPLPALIALHVLSFYWFSD